MRNAVRWLSIATGFFALTPAASAVAINWTPVGSPGNAADNTGFGAVGYAYSIGTYEVSNAQYADFLNAKAVSDPLALYNTNMGSGVGGITRTGSDGSYTYSVITGRGDMPVSNVSFYDTLRFANWLNNGQGAGDTETGAYTLLGGSATPSNGTTVTRNAGATIALTSENEWYKAAYSNALGTSYFDYPAGSNLLSTCAIPSAAPNTANCASLVGDLTAGGSYTGSASPFGTFDQGGNVWEWNEAIISGSFRGIRGGSFDSSPFQLAVTARRNIGPTTESNNVGFRVALIPEPGTGFLLMMSLLGLARWRKSIT
jgi:formylglycine-generating enzyme required for sulfatase activity